MNIRINLAIAVLFALFAVVPPAQAASFDCSKAGTKVEKMICSSESVSALDSKLQDEYSKALAQACDASDLKKIQRLWIKSRDTSVDEKGLSWMYEERIKSLVGRNAPTLEKYSVINPALGKYKIEVKRSGCVEYRSFKKQVYAITISDQSEKLIQKIEVHSSSSLAHLLSIIDMDGDGYKDFSISLGYGAGPFAFTSVYRFNKDKNQFEEDKNYPGGNATPSENAGCVYIEERMSMGNAQYDYEVTEWCFSPATNEWSAGKTCSLLSDKECYEHIGRYQKDWRKNHPAE